MKRINPLSLNFIQLILSGRTAQELLKFIALFSLIIFAFPWLDDGRLMGQSELQFKKPNQIQSNSVNQNYPGALSLPPGGTDFKFRITENKGQWDDNVKFRVGIPGGNLFLEENRLTYLFVNQHDMDEVHRKRHSSNDDYFQSTVIRYHAFNVTFLGANDKPKLIKDSYSRFSDYENFFIGDNPQKWASYVWSYGKVEYTNLYNGVDLKMYTNDRRIKYDYIVQPGASVDQIRMKYNGLTDLSLKNGILSLKTTVNEIEEHIPYAYQIINGKEVEVNCQYKLLPDNTVGFVFPHGYDKNYQVIIDPALLFATYTGSTADNWGMTATFDEQGNLYAGGVVFSDGTFPTTVGAFDRTYNGGIGMGMTTSTYTDVDMGIIKYNTAAPNQAAARVWATYIGGSHNDQPHSKITNKNGELFIMGTTRSQNYPKTVGCFQSALGGTYSNSPNTDGDIDIVVTRLDAAGATLIGSTFIGGSGHDGVNQRGGNSLYTYYCDDNRGEIILSKDEQNIFVVASTRSTNFPNANTGFKTTLGGTQDGVIFKMDAALTTCLFSSYIGGSANDAGYAVREASDGTLYFVGITVSTDLPATPGAFQTTHGGGVKPDGFMYHINAAGNSVLQCSYVQTTATDIVYLMDLDADDEVYICGHSDNNNANLYPTQKAPGALSVVEQDGKKAKQFISKFSQDLSTMIFNAKFGSSGETKPNINITAFMVDRCENLYACGWGGTTAGSFSAGTTGMPTVNPYDAISDDNDFYLIAMSRNAEAVTFATFLGQQGGTGDHVDGGTSRFDKKGIVYHSVCASCGGGNAFPTNGANPAWSTNNNASNCNMASFKFDFQVLADVVADFNFDTTTTQGCVPFNVTFDNLATVRNPNNETVTYSWDFGYNNLTSNQQNPGTIVYNDPGIYRVRLIVEVGGLCGDKDTTYKDVIVYAPSNANITVTPRPCTNIIDITNSTSGGTTYKWYFGDNTTSTEYLPAGGTHTYQNPGTYTVAFVVNTGSFCKDSTVRTISVGGLPDASFTHTQNPCSNDVSFTYTATNDQGNRTWNFGDNTTSIATGTFVHSFPGPGTYRVVLKVAENVSCPDSQITNITINPPTVAGAVTPPQTICSGRSFNTLTLAGHTGSVLRWEQSIDGGSNWTTINSTTTTLAGAVLTRTTMYRAVVQSFNCAVLNSASATITVDPVTVAGSLTAGSTVCTGSASQNITLSGQTGTIIRWEAAATQAFNPMTTINNVTTTQATGVLNNAICFRAVVKSGVCDTARTTPTCFVVDPQTEPGTLPPSTTVCEGSPTQSLTITGPVVGTVQHWESAPNVGFTPITTISNTTTTQTVNGPINATICFRAFVKSGTCAGKYTNSTCINVDPKPKGGDITPGPRTCAVDVNSNATVLTLSGHTGSIENWQSSTDNFTTVTTINNTGTTHTVDANMTVQTCFRVSVTRGVCLSVFSDTVCVDPNTIPGTSSGGTTVCKGTTGVQVNLTGHRTTIIRWESSPTVNGSYTAIPNSGGIVTLTVSNPINDPICFRAVIQNGVCPQKTSVPTCFSVDPGTIPGAVSTSQTVCEGTSNLTLTLSGQNGQILGWRSSTDNFVTSTIINNNTNTLNISTPVLVTTCYRASVKSGTCDSAFSTPACITIDPPTLPGDLRTDETVCSGKPITPLTLTGVRGNVLRWEQSDNSNFSPLTTINSTTTTYDPGTISNTTSNNITKCFRAVVKNGQCPELPSDTFCVVIEPPTLPGTLDPARTICQGDATGTMTLTGFRGSILRWESSGDCGFAIPVTIVNTTNVHSVANLQTTTCFRAQVKNGTCDQMPSNCVCMTVDLPSEGGIASGGGTICKGNPAPTLSVSGKLGEVTRWESSIDDGVTWVTITNNTTSLSPGNLSVSTCFRAIVKNGTCPEDPSEFTCVQVDPPTEAGIVSSNNTVCYGSNSTVLTLSGNNGVIVKWQSAPAESGPYTDFVNTTNTFTASNLTASTCYRAAVKSGVCPEDFSRPACVIVDPTSVGGSVSDNKTLCYGDPAGNFTLSGNIGVIQYWESSIDGQVSWIRLNNPATATLSPGNVTQDICFRAKVKSGVCDTAISSPACVTVSPTTEAGTLMNPSTICAGSNGGSLLLIGTVGTIQYWELSTDGSTWTTFANTQPTFTPIGLLTTTCYRVTVKSGVCPAATSNPICVTVDQPTIPGSISGTNTICYGSPTGLMKLNGERGTILNWEQSIDNGATWTTFPNFTNSYNISVLTQSTCFRATIKNGVCPEAKSQPACITIDLPSDAGIAGGDTLLCNGTSTSSLNLTGIRGNVLRWEKTFDCNNGPWQVINVQTTTLSTGGLQRTVCYRAFVKNGVCPEDVSNIVKIEVSPQIFSDLSYINNNKCFGQTRGAIGHNVSGGTPPYTYKWSGGETTEDIENKVGGTYTVTITDSKGCTAIYTYEINDPPKLENRINSVVNIDCNGYSTGSIGVDVYGGTQPYHYTWYGPNNTIYGTEDLQGIIAGTYRLVAKDANGCQTTQLVKVTEPAKVSATVTTSPGPGCTYTATVVGSGGSGKYTYKWNTGQTTQTVDNLVYNKGYSVEVTDSSGCKTKVSVIDTSNAIRIVVNQFENVKCYGGSNGRVAITVYGGFPEYTYSWTSTTNGFTSTKEDIDDMVAGTYSIVITDKRGCKINQTWTITQPEVPLKLTTVKIDSVKCYGSNTGAIDIDVSGGTTPYTYLWTGGMTTQDLNNLKAGSYAVHVIDANGCEIRANYILIEADSLDAKLNFVHNPSCAGGTDGSIGYNIYGGTQPYSYLWSNGSTKEDIKNIPAGTYSFTATDVNGCTTTRTVKLISPKSIEIQVTKIIDATCSNSEDGSISVNVIGGTGVYTYEWSNNSRNKDLSGVGRGKYTLIVTDANNCKITREIEVKSPTPIAAKILVHKNASCFGGKDGFLFANVSGGTQPYTMEWKLGTEIVSNAMQASALSAGYYVFKVTDKNGCSTTLIDSILQPTELKVRAFTVENAMCFGALQGEIKAIAEGGTPPYSYTWNGQYNGENPKGIPAGAYNVEVIDANGCKSSASTIVTEPTKLVASIKDKKDVSCLGSSDGRIRIYVEGGLLPYTYIWNTGKETQNIDSLPAGSYNVTVTDKKGCKSIISNILITEPKEILSVSVSYINPVKCHGDQSGAIGIDVTGGKEPYSYQWSNFSGIEDQNKLNGGEYSVTVIDAAGCTVIKTMYVDYPKDPLAIAVDFITTPTCYNSSDGSIGVNISGGTLPYKYEWSDGSTVEDIQNLPAGKYTLKVIDEKGCFIVKAFDIEAPQPIKIDIVDVVASGCQPNGSARALVTGGVPPYTYLWSNGSLDSTMNEVDAGNYIFSVKDFKGCVVSKTVIIPKAKPLSAKIIIVKPLSCGDASDGILSVEVSGGSVPYKYTWGTGDTTPSITGLREGVYGVYVTDGSGCEYFLSATLQPTDALKASAILLTHPRCAGANNGSIILNVLGGSKPYTYQWSNGSILGSQTGLKSGIYTVTVTEKGGCKVVERFELIDPQPITVTTGIQTNVSCNGLSDGLITAVATGGNGSYTYLWSSGETTQTIKNKPEGMYTVTVKDKNNCVGVKEFRITQPDPLIITTGTITPANCNGGSNGAISINVTGGTLPYSYTWSNTTFGNSAVNLKAGKYSVVVSDANGCTNKAEFDVPTYSNIKSTLLSLDSVCVDGPKVTLRGTPPGGIFEGSGVTGNKFDPSVAGAGTHIITYRGSQNGCIFSVSKEIKVLPKPEMVTITAGGRSEFCASETSTFILNATPIQRGVTITYSGKGVMRSNGIYRFSPSAAGPGEHNITVTLRSSAGCVLTTMVVMKVTKAVSLKIESESNFVCKGSEMQLTATGADEYTWEPNTGLSSGTGSTVTASPDKTTTYTVTGKTGGCLQSKTITVTVKDVSLINATATPGTICAGEKVDLIADSRTNYVYTWSPVDGLDKQSGAKVSAYPTVSTVYTVTGTFEGCTMTQMINVTVLESSVSIISEKTKLCPGESTVLTVSSGIGDNSVYEWTPAIGLDKTIGKTVVANPQNTTTYTVKKVGGTGCATAIITLDVVQKPDVKLTAPEFVCTNGSKVTIGASVLGGVFSGNGVSGNLFDPINAGPGTHTITYTLNDSKTGCKFTYTKDIVVGFPGVLIVNLLPTYCIIAEPVILVGSPTGGTFSGPGVNGGVFNPSEAGTGTHTIKYTGVSPQGCAYSYEQKVTVATTDAAISGISSVYCISSGPIVMTGIPEGGRFTGKGVNGSIFTPNIAGVGSHSITYFGQDGPCTYSKTITVKVTQSITSTATATSTSCSTCSDGKINVLANGGTQPYSYSLNGGPEQGSSVFSNLKSGTYLITVRDAGGCITTITAVVSTDKNSCNAPTSVSASSTSTTITVTWPVVLNVGTYEVLYRRANMNESFQTLVVQGNSVVINSLNSNTLYEIQVRSICESGKSSFVTTTSTTAKDTGCEKVTNLKIVPGLNSGSLTWNAVPGATRYQVSWKRMPNGNLTSMFVMTSSANLRNIFSNTQYMVKVRAICGSNFGSFSDELNFTTLSGKEIDTQPLVEEAVTVYPNPNKGSFALKFHSNESESVKVQIFNIEGKLIMDQVLTAVVGWNEWTIEPQDISSGIYILQVIEGDEINTVKLVIE